MACTVGQLDSIVHSTADRDLETLLQEWDVDKYTLRSRAFSGIEFRIDMAKGDGENNHVVRISFVSIPAIAKAKLTICNS